MRPFHVSCVLILTLALGLASLQAQAQTSQAGVQANKARPGPELDAGSVRAWLARMQDAAAQRDFQGTLMFSAGGSVHSARIVHVCAGKDRIERIDALDGQVRQIFRQNRVVHTFWPESRLVVLEQRDTVADFPALLQGGVDRIAEQYELRNMGVDRVAGHEADVLLLLPRDTARFAHRLWAERKSGLLLRAEILGERLEVLESSAFTELSLGPRLTADALLQSMPRTEGLRVIRKVTTPVKLEAEGWTLGELVPGFQQVSCVKRPMSARPPEGDASQNAVQTAVQLVFSDGMTYVSMFIEPLAANQSQQVLQAAVGATHTLMRRQGDWWITVMGDVPMTTLQRFFVALERRR